MLLYLFNMVLAETLVMIEMDKMEMNIHLTVVALVEDNMVVDRLASRGSMQRRLLLVMPTTSTPWPTP
jgi:hypothetical protein